MHVQSRHAAPRKMPRLNDIRQLHITRPSSLLRFARRY
jgi:hypothetical protein